MRVGVQEGDYRCVMSKEVEDDLTLPFFMSPLPPI